VILQLGPGQKLKLFQNTTQLPLINAKGSATATGTAVAELLNSQLCIIQLISVLAGACIPIYFYCLKIERTKNVALVLIVSGLCQFNYFMLCDSKETVLLT
jgi:hypothetical protein